MARAEESIDKNDLPALYRMADSVSLSAQKRYLRFMQTDLALLIAGAVFASITMSDSAFNRVFLSASALSLTLSIVITFILHLKSYKKQWYNGRAAAESVKTLTWRYMMRAEPFHDHGNQEVVDQKFVTSLGEVLQESIDLPVIAHEDYNAAQTITPRMEDVRESSLEKRKEVYLIDRIEDQRSWYSKKASMNARREAHWFWVVGGAQLLAIVAAIMMIVWPEFQINPTGLFSTIAASALAWLQVKQHEELAQSYAVAAHELVLIADLARHATDEAKFSTFVADAEAAMSREHTLWLARRDQLLVQKVRG